MKARDFTPFRVYVDYETDEYVHVSFVGRRRLRENRGEKGHPAGGSYGDKKIELWKAETIRSLRGAIWHELAHYFIEREEWRIGRKGIVVDVTEEEVCDLFYWIPALLADPRNERLRALMGVEL